MHRLRWDLYPFYRFCSRRCQDFGAALAERNLGVIDKSELERQAVREARQALAATLTDLNLMAPFFNRSASDIDRIIETCVDSYHEAVVRLTAESRKKSQALLDDEIPF